ncbi:MAG: T9SS type A sorting domain-containing protein [Bacteroidales bacterium]|nr:T9SS type A sorting domain-containing protein [Bacteroidales bacterium]
MKKTVIIGIVMLLGAAAGLRAQDTIDTNYYRYDINFGPGIYGYVDPYTQETVNLCPNGVGFLNHGIFWVNGNFDGYLSYGQVSCNPYMLYKLSKDQTVYGIAIAIDSIANFTYGDSLMVILCDMADDSTHFVHLDSITIKGCEIGKRRWMEIPIAYSNISSTYREPLDNCIDTILYNQVLEFYFDRPVRVGGSSLWWKARLSVENGSDFKLTSEAGPGYYCSVDFYSEQGRYAGRIYRWHCFFPLITALPEWERSSMSQVIPCPDGAVIPDPDNPDPDDPDPDDPGGDEGIDNLEIQNSAFKINIVPNPADSRTTITCDLPITELTLRDINGRLILTLRNCGTSTTLDTSTLTPGLYTLKVTTPTGTTTRKLAVK